MLTDNCQEERNALKSTWPSITVLLCIFHMLQQTWRWLTDKKHGISQGERPYILSKFTQALFANSQPLFERLYSSLLGDKIVQDYEKALRYFDELYEDREAFALCFRSSLLVRGNQTKNFVESHFLVLKDIILRPRLHSNGTIWIRHNLVMFHSRLHSDGSNLYRYALTFTLCRSEGYFMAWACAVQFAVNLAVK